MSGSGVSPSVRGCVGGRGGGGGGVDGLDLGGRGPPRFGHVRHVPFEILLRLSPSWCFRDRGGVQKRLDLLGVTTLEKVPHRGSDAAPVGGIFSRDEAGGERGSRTPFPGVGARCPRAGRLVPLSTPGVACRADIGYVRGTRAEDIYIYMYCTKRRCTRHFDAMGSDTTIPRYDPDRT